MKLGGILATSFGGMSMITGAALLPIGLAKDEGGFTTAGAITLSAGAVAVAIGIWALRRGASIERPGSANHFQLR
jgi:hypothetical protein